MLTLRSYTRQKAQRSSNNSYSSTLEITRQPSWDFLPQDIRRLILEMVSRQEGWGSATSVCKEWQYFIATKNLGRLELNQSSVHGLGKLVRQRHLIRHIYLNVELPKFNCPSCNGRWFTAMVAETSTVRTSSRKLFSILRKWGLDCRITLELNVYSPSEPSHWFKNHLFGFNREDEDLKLLHDPKHSWEHGKQVLAPHTRAINRLFTPFTKDGLISLNYSANVPAIKKLIIRRQMRRRIPQSRFRYCSSDSHSWRASPTSHGLCLAALKNAPTTGAQRRYYDSYRRVSDRSLFLRTSTNKS
jgi:hypothetical protein